MLTISIPSNNFPQHVVREERDAWILCYLVSNDDVENISRDLWSKPCVPLCPSPPRHERRGDGNTFRLGLFL